MNRRTSDRRTFESANFIEANLHGAKFTEADLSRAILIAADLSLTDFTRADLRGARLFQARLHGTTLDEADLTGCYVYGVSAWDVSLEGAIQKDLVITPEGQSVIQVDRLELAQFVYLLLNKSAIRSVIDTITSKVVLILGPFLGRTKSDTQCPAQRTARAKLPADPV